jgi:DNA-binding MarR family transcriptional regulator
MRDQQAEEIVSLVFALVERMRSHFEASIAEFDLSPPQAKALRFLAATGPAPMREVAASLHCDASNVTGIIDRLEARGLVERRSGPGDRRVKTLVLTDAGRELSARLWARVLDGAPPVARLDEADQQTLVVLLHRLHDGAAPGGWCPRQSL